MGFAKDLVALPFCCSAPRCRPGQAERSSGRSACLPQPPALLVHVSPSTGQPVPPLHRSPVKPDLQERAGGDALRVLPALRTPCSVTLPPSRPHPGSGTRTGMAPSRTLRLASFHGRLCRSRTALGSKGPAFGPSLMLLGRRSPERSLLKQWVWGVRRGPTAHASHLGHAHPVAVAGEPFPSSSNPGLCASPICKSALR